MWKEINSFFNSDFMLRRKTQRTPTALFKLKSSKYLCYACFIHFTRNERLRRGDEGMAFRVSLPSTQSKTCAILPPPQISTELAEAQPITISLRFIKNRESRLRTLDEKIFLLLRHHRRMWSSNRVKDSLKRFFEIPLLFLSFFPSPLLLLKTHFSYTKRAVVPKSYPTICS